MRKIKKYAAVLCLLLACICLCSCGAESAAGLSLHSEIEGVLTTDYIGQNISAMETGVFDCYGGLLTYYDFASEKKFVLCSNPNCKHDSADCAAYVRGDDVTGYGLYKDRVYYFRNDPLEKRGYIEFVSMKPDGTDVKTIKKLELGDDISGNVRIRNVQDVVYANGKAVCSVVYVVNYMDETGEYGYGNAGLMIIDLNSGETLLSLKEHPLLKPGYLIEDVNKKYVMIEASIASEALLSLDEFKQNEKAQEKYQNYSKYMSGADMEREILYSGLLIDLDSLEIKELYSGVLDKDQNGTIGQRDVSYGMTEEEVLILRKDEIKERRYTQKNLIAHNIESGEERSLIEFRGEGMVGPFWTTSFRYETCLFDNQTKVLYCEEAGNKLSVSYLDLETGEKVHLYDDKLEYDWIFASDLTGEYDDYFVLAKYPNEDSVALDFYLIAKDDYLSGNLSKAKKIY